MNTTNGSFDFPQLLIIKHLEDIKTKVDNQYVKRLGQITNPKLIERTKEKWLYMIELIERCEEKYLDERLTNEIIYETQVHISRVESNDQIDTECLETGLLVINKKLDAFLYSLSKQLY